MPNNNNAVGVDIKTNRRRKGLNPRFIVPVLVLIAVVIYLFFQGYPTESLHLYYQVTMDTSVELRFVSGSSQDAEQIRDNVFAEMERLEALFSRSLEGSNVDMINRSAGSRSATVNGEVLYVALRAVDYAVLSDGAFDPTIAPLIDLWGFLGHEYRVPSFADLEISLPLVDYTVLEIDRELSTVYLPVTGMALELGGIAKGYIVDQTMQVLLAEGIEHAYVNAGGDIGLIGTKSDGSPWRIGVRHPRDANKIIAVLSASGGAVVTSGDYERAFIEAGISYHHILNPKTGMPARELTSVTIIAKTAIEADALSTTIFVLGPLKGMALIEQLTGVEGILITPDLQVLISSGLQGLVELEL